MKYSKLDLLSLVLEPYVLDILKKLKKRKMRFSELKITVKNERTLSIKLAKLEKHRLIAVVPVNIKGKYANFYDITKRGLALLNAVENIRIFNV